jgi:hypothetical protein
METKEMTTAKAQDIQDQIFRKMPVEKKLEMLDIFFRFTKELSPLNKNDGRNRNTERSNKNFKKA